jgi:hypothetical protein
MPVLTARSGVRRWAPIVLVGAGLAALPILALRPISDPSPWLHLRVGRFLLDGRRFALPDPWGPFATHSYVPTQWLPSVVTTALYDHFGNPVIAWERAAGIGVLTLALLLWLCSLARPWLAAVVTAVTMFAAWPGLTERPQLAGFILLVPVLAAWWRTGLDHRPRWYLLPLTWLAASTHGVWATGVALGGLVTFSLVLSRSVTRPVALRLAAVVAGSLVAAACTPLGPKLLLTPFAVSAQGRQFVSEWLPSSVRSPEVIAVLALLAVAWLSWTQLRRRPALWQLALLLAGCALALTMERTVPIAAFVGAALAASGLEDAITARSMVPIPMPRPRLALTAWCAATLVGLGIAAPLAITSAAADPTDVPTALLPRLTAMPAGTRVLAQGDLTGWILDKSPQLRLVEDLRIESYSSTFIKRYIAAMAAQPGWESFVQDTGAKVAVLPTDSPLQAALREQSHWTTLATAGGIVLLEAPQ